MVIVSDLRDAGPTLNDLVMVLSVWSTVTLRHLESGVLVTSIMTSDCDSHNHDDALSSNSDKL